MPRTMDGLELLRREHQEVDGLFRRFEKAGDPDEQREIGAQIVSSLEKHATLEEEIFYPFLREATGREDLVEEAAIEHQSAKALMQAVQAGEPGTPRYSALVTVLGEYVRHHVEEEEQRIFPVVAKLGIDLEALGDELAVHREQLVGSGNGRTREAEPKRRLRRGNGDGGGRDTGASEGERTDAKGKRHSDTSAADARFLEEHGDDLSPSTRRAKWIHHPDEHEDRPGQTLVTRNHEVIRRWAEERRGTPATSPNGNPEQPRVLRFDFPEGDRKLQEVGWDAWFRTFDDRDLVFLFQEHMKAGNTSNFFRLDSPSREDG